MTEPKILRSFLLQVGVELKDDDTLHAYLKGGSAWIKLEVIPREGGGLEEQASKLGAELVQWIVTILNTDKGGMPLNDR